MRRSLWLLPALLFVGCEPAEVTIDVRSPRRVDESVSVVVPKEDDKLALALLQRSLPGDWRTERERTADGSVRLTLRRTVNPEISPEAQLDRTVIGPLRLRYEYHFRAVPTFPNLPPGHPARAALGDVDVTVRLRLPGRVLQDSTAAGSVTADGATWVLKTKALIDKPPVFEATSRCWRWGWLVFWLVLLALALWVLMPWWAPPAEVAKSREERKAERAARAAARAAAKQQRAAERAQRGRRGRKPAAQPAPAEPQAAEPETVAAEPEPVPAPEEEPTAEPEPAEAEAEEPSAEPEPAPAPEEEPTEEEPAEEPELAEAEADEVMAEPEETPTSPESEPQPVPAPSFVWTRSGRRRARSAVARRRRARRPRRR